MKPKTMEGKMKDKKEKEKMKCTKKAEYLIPWGGKQIKACEKHAKQLTILGNVIGSPVQVAKVAMEDECTMEGEE